MPLPLLGRRKIEVPIPHKHRARHLAIHRRIEKELALHKMKRATLSSQLEILHLHAIAGRHRAAQC